MRIHSLVVVCALSTGCAVDVDDPGPDTCADCENVEAGAMKDPAQGDVCALAAELGSDDICSLICDPPAMAQRMVEDGGTRGACYQLYCSLNAEEHVLVGVCLPP